MANLDPINPLLYIKPHDPIPEEVMSVSSWFATETMELDFGEWVGRPSNHVALRTSMLNYFFANGWYVDAVLSKGEGGTWKSISRSESQADGSSTNSNESSSSASSSMSASGTSSATDSPATGAPATGLSNTTSTGASEGSATSSGQASNSSSARGQSESDGAPFWFAYQRIRLKRRHMKTESVLQDMISSFTKAYNEGRRVNDERYDELVALYALMLSKTESELNQLPDIGADFKPLADMVVNAVKDALAEYREKAGDIPDEWMKSRIDEINRKFDALLSQKRSEAITTATYNTTVWTTTESGIERDRQIALNDLKDTMVTAKIDAYGKIASITGDIGQKLLDTKTRIIEALSKHRIEPTTLRNTVLKWMLDFMEKRDDDYPGLDSISTIAERLGYSEGAVGNPTSS